MSAPVGPDVPRAAPALVAPAALLGGLSLLFGLWVVLPDEVVVAASQALDPEVHLHLALWHGYTTALLLSAIAITGGAAAFWWRDPIERWQANMKRGPSAVGAYQATVARLNSTARSVTRIVQTGSLPYYLGIILVAAVAGPSLAFLSTDLPDAERVFAESPLQVFVAGLVMVAALGATRAERRFTAVLLLGAVGYGVAVLFVLQGAPDLALTQMLIETLSLVLFVLVLKLLPDRFRVSGSRLRVNARVAV